ncbi:MAG TPA: pyruvate kinase [Pyrinomonadaceae bacterium]
MSKDIWCTLGPSSLNDHVINRLDELGVGLLRLNLSHTKIDDLAKTLKYIRTLTDVPICLDTEGAQIRTFAATNLSVHENRSLRVYTHPRAGDPDSLAFYPEGIVHHLMLGDLLKIDAEVLAQVIQVDSTGAVLWVLNGGHIGSSKATTVLERDIAMPAVTDKDRQAIALGKDMGIRHVALSFANSAADVDLVREMAGKKARIISKIECLNGLLNLDDIASHSDAILIDRGDLSRQVNLEKLPFVQKQIIRRANELNVPVYVATNLMESMVTSPNPTRAEVNDVYNTLKDGADGLVLAGETAIGDFPVAAASMVRRLIGEFENNRRWQRINYSPAPMSLLVEPHGGCLVNREALWANRHELLGLKKLVVKSTDLMDCAQVANGMYSPLRGFMTREELTCVLQTNRLPSGHAWTMPIVLQVDEADAENISVGDRIALTNRHGKIHATLDVSEMYTFDFDELTGQWFGTTSHEHPGVARVARGGNRFVAGDITLVDRLTSPYQRYELSPAQTRLIFSQKGWSKVVGFHTRNVPHRVHEFIQVRALEKVHADGLYISPVIGPKKAGDFLADPILKSYQLLLEANVYPPGKVVLGAFSTYSRYCGPREAVFTAICRKNVGCSHFIVGRDHAGVAGYYHDGQTRELFDSLDGLGINPIFFEPFGFNPTTNQYSALTDPDALAISGTRLRSALLDNDPLPDWYVRDDVQAMLREQIATNRPIFCDREVEVAAAQ